MYDPFYEIRYFHYARIQNRTPEEQYRHDRARFHSATLAGYTFWLQSRIIEYSELRPEAFSGAALRDAQAFHEWLASLPCEQQTPTLTLASKIYPPSLA